MWAGGEVSPPFFFLPSGFWGFFFSVGDVLPSQLPPLPCTILRRMAAPAGEAKVIVLRTVGGEIGAAASLAPKVGPLGLVRAAVVPCGGNRAQGVCGGVCARSLGVLGLLLLLLPPSLASSHPTPV
jgi:hypothetical protein